MRRGGLAAAVAGTVALLAGAVPGECGALPPASSPPGQPDRPAFQQLRSVKRLRHFLGKTDSEIVMRIASEAQLGARVDPTAPARGVVVQKNLTDWDFLAHLARRNGFRVWVDERQRVLHFRSRSAPIPAR